MELERIIQAADESGSGRTVLLAVIIAVTFAVAGSSIAYLNQEPDYAVSSHALPRLSPKMQDWAKRLRDEPCNRTLAAQLVSGLLDQAEYGAIIRFSEQTKLKCGPNEKLLPAVYTAQMQSSDFPAAEGTADELIAEYPADPVVYGWRAKTREKRGDFTGAYADLLDALSLFPDPSRVDVSVYYELARLAAKAEHPCDAVATLRDYIAYDPANRHTLQLATLMREWQKQGSCAPLSGMGTAFLRYNPNSTSIIVSVEVNGLPARMIFDTGASSTLLTKQFASRAGIEPSGPQGAIVTTANGKAWVARGRAHHIALGGARLNDVPVFIQNSADGSSLGDDVDGLLGLSFLGNFYFRVGRGTLELRPLG